MTSATPQSRSSGSRRCARLTRSWTPVRIFTVTGTSSTCGHEGREGAESRPGGRTSEPCRGAEGYVPEEPRLPRSRPAQSAGTWLSDS